MAGRPPFDQFNSEAEDIDNYLERLQEYFIAYDFKDGTEHAAKRRAILLTSIGSVSYRVLKDLSFPDTKTFEQLAALLRGHYKPTRLKVAERYRFHSANQRPGESITDFVRELKKLAGTCEFTNDQLQDSLCDRFICGVRSEQIKRKLLSANYTFQEAVDAAIAQETAQKDVQALGSNSLGVRSQAGVNKVKRDSLASRNRTSTTGRRNARNDKKIQPTGATQRCFRCGLTNHSPDNCKYKDSECHRCHKKGIYGPSVATRSHHAQKPREDNMFGSLIRTPQRRRQWAAKINSLSLFSIWMAHSPLFPRTQVWPHQQLRFLC